MGFLFGEVRLNFKEPIRFIVRMRNDETGVVGTRCVELHSIELDDFRNHFSRHQELRIGLLDVDFAMMRAAMVRGYHPAESVILGHRRIHLNRIDRIAGDDGSWGIDCTIPVDGEARVDVVVASQPLAAGFDLVSSAGFLVDLLRWQCARHAGKSQNQARRASEGVRVHFRLFDRSDSTGLMW